MPRMTQAESRRRLALIRAHAVLHQATRGKEEDGRIIATEQDYMAVRKLILPVVSQGTGAAVSETIRETVAAVEELAVDHPEGVPASALGRLLELDKSAARRRLLSAMDGGYVRNQEERRGRPGRYILGEAMPEYVEILPLLPDDGGSGIEVVDGLATTTTDEIPGQRPVPRSGGTVATKDWGVETPDQ
jgi:hypothetical protein